MISQVKVDLAVLHKLFEMVEMDYGSGTPVEIVGLFEVPISSGRVELALQELERSKDAMTDPDHRDRWQITRDGMRRVEKSLGIPTTFLARINKKGDIWLESDEAHRAVVKQRVKGPLQAAESVVFLQEELEPKEPAGIVWSKVGAIASVVAIPVSILIWFLN
jgi:negative regulator of sigma E activity